MSVLEDLKAKATFLEGDAKDAGIRLGGKQFFKMTKAPLVAFLGQQLGSDDPSMRARVARFIDTEFGESLVKLMLSLGLGTLPESVGPAPQVLSRELRVQSMVGVGDVVADLLMEPLRDFLSKLVSGEVGVVPALPAESVVTMKVPALQEVQEEQPIPTKLVAAR